MSEATAAANRLAFERQLEAHGVSAERAGGRGRSRLELVSDVALSLSGLACWPRLVLDEGTEDEPPIIIESRGEMGEPRPSHWQTVLPLLSTKPVGLHVGDVLRVEAIGEGPVRPGDAVTLIISRGPDLVTVPDVVGLSINDAVDRLREEGFEVNLDTNVPPGLRGSALAPVQSTDPAGGTQVFRSPRPPITVTAQY